MTRQRNYTGYSGQFAVIAELLFRQCNVAVPEVDMGLDLFAFEDHRPELDRIQIKTAQGERYKSGEGYSAQFDIPLKQLAAPDFPILHYVLAARLEGRFEDFFVISRAEMCDYWNDSRPFGTENLKSGNLVLTVRVRPNQVLCGEIELTQHRNDWARLPVVRSFLAQQHS